MDGIYGFVGTINKKDDDTLSFVIDGITSPSELKPEAVSRIHIRLYNYVEITRDGLASLMPIFTKYNGNTPVSIEIAGISGEELQLKSTSYLEYTKTLIAELEELDVVDKAWVS